MTATRWTTTTFTLFILFWILQLAAVISHICFITTWIGFLALKTNVEQLAYIYTTLLISAGFFTTLLLTEIMFQLRSTLTVERYRKLQFIKTRICLVEILALGILCHGVEDPSGIVTSILVLTACAGIPFNFSLGLAVFMRRRERTMGEMASKEVDEETPLLNGC